MAIVTTSINEKLLNGEFDGYTIRENIKQDLNFSIETGIIDNGLASALYSMPHIQGTYTVQGKSFSDFLSDNFNQLGKGFSYSLDSTGDVDLGWSANMQSDGKLSLTNGGGRAGRDYDEWSLNKQLEGVWTLDASLFDADNAKWSLSGINGDGTSAPEYSLGFGQEKSDYFLGTDTGVGQSFGSANTFETSAIPEPATTVGLLGAVALAFVAAKRSNLTIKFKGFSKK